jgi:glutaredoxin 3
MAHGLWLIAPRASQGLRWTVVLIFGKDTCPYTQAARDHYLSLAVPFEYVNVRKHPAELERMLALSHGKREVPVIVEDGKVTIGFGGT